LFDSRRPGRFSLRENPHRGDFRECARYFWDHCWDHSEQWRAVSHVTGTDPRPNSANDGTAPTDSYYKKKKATSKPASCHIEPHAFLPCCLNIVLASCSMGFNMAISIKIKPYNFRTTVTMVIGLIQTQMAQKPMLRAEVGMRVRCANKASAE